MKIEIWSDVMCPFCYLGKRKFEMAMDQFEERNNLEIEWKSFQLNPYMTTQKDKSINQYLVEEKVITMEHAQTLNDRVTQMGQQVGIDYKFDKAIPANTFKAHQLIHLAGKYGKQHEAKELLFQSFFTEGKNVDDVSILVELGETLGLDSDEVRNTFNSQSYAQDVHADVIEARNLGVNGVPFFVFNRKYAVSGAQEVNTFLETLKKSYSDWAETSPKDSLEVTDGDVCTPDGSCD